MPQKTEILKPKMENKNDTNINKNIPKKNYSTNLLKKCQMKYNSFIKEHKDLTMSGTKRYENKSGEYYLQNLGKFQKNNLNQKSITTRNINYNSDTKNNSTNYKSNKNVIKVKKKKLDDELIPIPIVKQSNKLKNDYEKKNLNNAMDNAKYIRRFQYSNNITQKQIQQYKEMQKNEKIYFNKIKYIQIWWKTIYQIIKIQKYLRGYLYRIKLISILDQREQYIDKVLLLIKSIKKIFLNKFYNKINVYKKDYKRNFFLKWIELIYKKKIIKDLINNYSSQKIFKEFHNNNNIFTSRSNKKNKEKIYDFKNEFNKSLNKNNEKMRNRSFIALHKNSIKKDNNRRRQHLSSSSFIIRPKKKNLQIGIELSSSQILRKPKKHNLYELNQTNYNKKKKKLINNKKVNIFGLCKSDNKRNKTNNKKVKKIKNDKTTNNTLNNLEKKYQKERSYNDLHINKKINRNKDSNSNKNLTIISKNINDKQDLTKSLNNNEFNKDIKLNTTNHNNINKSKRNVKNKKKINNNTSSNIQKYTCNILNKKSKKKIKVYENKLKDYNKKMNIENNEKELLSINKNNIPYVESIFDESQFSAILDSSTLINNKNLINSNNNEADLFNKKMRSNSCIEANSLIYQESIDINENKSILKQYLKIWEKKTIFRLIMKKKRILKNVLDGENMISKYILDKIYNEFINKIKIYFNYLDLQKKINIWKIKIYIKAINKFANKYILLKYFNNYKNIITKKIIIQKIVQYYNNDIKIKNKQIKKRNKNQFLYSDFNLDNHKHNHYITDISINNYNNNFINNNINLNNNTNNCYIINNLNYNDTDIDKNNSNQNNNNSFGIIHSKIIEFPKNIYKQKKVKQSLALYKLNNNILINGDFDNSDNSNNINNTNLFNYNLNSNNKRANDKSFNSYKEKLSKTVIIPNKINYLKSDLTAQKNQLLMVINIIEHHRKEKYYKLFLSDFKKWKNYDKTSNNYENASNQNEKIINCSGGTIDYEELSKNSIATDGFHTESDSKSENKVSTKSAKIYPNNQLNIKLNLDNPKGIYKKKTISNSLNKTTIYYKKNNVLNSNILNLKDINNSSNLITNNNNNELIYEDIHNSYKKPLNNKNIDFMLNNNNINNLKYTSPEEYFGFKKVNKIEELEISFFPSGKKQITPNNIINNNSNNSNISISNNNNTIINFFNYNLNNKKEKNNNYDYKDIDKKDVIIEAIEEYNECEGENENIIQKIKNEFLNYEHLNLYRTFDELKISFDNIINEEEEKEDIKYNSMIII